MQKSVAELAQLVQGKVVGDPQTIVRGITNVENPIPGTIAFIQNPKDLAILEKSEISCIIVPNKINHSAKTMIQVAEPKLAWAKLLRVFYPPHPYSGMISTHAFISETAKIGNHVTIEPFAVIGEETIIGDNSVIRSHAFVGRKVQIGSNCVLHPAVMVYDECILGSQVILHSGAVIGADGFGYVHTAQGQEKVPQVGNVIIEDDVEIGACTAIDRATVGSTKIGKGTKIDNLVQIGHNVAIGPHTVISSQTGISGSCKIGAHVTMGGQVGLGDHVEIGDWTMVGAGAGFPSGKKVPPKQIVFGQPARPYQEARKQIAAQLRSAEMLDEIRKLRERVSELEKQISSPKT